MKQPTPEQIRTARHSAVQGGRYMTMSEAAKIVRVSMRTWQNWEAPTGSKENRLMPLGLWELFLVKTNQKPPVRDIEEFACIWFEQTRKWIVLLPDGTTIDRNFGAIGYATGAVYELTGRGEAEFDCVDTGDFYRFVKCGEHWSQKPPL
jgi:hypothetical protein